MAFWLITNMIKQLRLLIKKLDLKLNWLFIPISTSIIATILESISILALFPFIRGVITTDFSFASQAPFFSTLLSKINQTLPILNTSLFFILLGIIFSASALKILFQYLGSVTLIYYLEQTSHKIRNKVFNRYLGFGKQYFDQNSAGKLQNILMGFTEYIRQLIQESYSALNSLIILPLILIIMLLISWQLTIFMISISLIFYSYTKWLAKRIKPASSSFAETTNALNKKIFNFFSCIPLIKAYNHEQKEGQEFAKFSEEIANLRFSMDKKLASLGPFQEIVFLAAILLLICAAAFLFISGRQELVNLLVYFYLIKRGTSAFLMANTFIGALAIKKGPLDEILNVFDDKGKFYVPDGKQKFTGLRNQIEFRHLNFSYANGKSVLNNVSFSIEKGEITALVGPTGSGKTSLINLLLRFYDCPPSSIFIDDTDIREFTTKSVRDQCSLISQDAHLFNDTIKNNVIYGLKREISSSEIYLACKHARILDLILQLPHKFNTIIGDRGVKLSGGEKQRLTIARSLLKKSEILILDEATSALDTETEKMIETATAEAIKGKTAIVIAHRLSTIRNAHKIIFIENGEIIEKGRLDYLLSTKSRFFNAWQKQRL